MKRSILYIASAAVLSLMSACSGDFIEKTPELEIDETSIFSSETRLAAAIEGVYSNLKDSYFMGGYAIVAGDNRTDDMINYGNNGYTFRDCYGHAVNASSLETVYLFEAAYLAINYANTIYEGLATTYADELPIDDATAEKYKQECLFVRAISYYYLSQLYGQPYSYNPSSTCVPLRITAVTGPGENLMEAATVSAVLNQVLEDTENISYLPEGFSDDDFTCTKASQAAAHALRMRVYMCMEDWSSAIKEGEYIMGEGFSLIDDIATMFDSPYALTAENILSMPMTTLDKSGSQTHPAGYFTSDAGTITVVNNINGIATEYNLEADARTDFLYTNEYGYTFCMKYDEFSTLLEWIPVFRYAEILLNMAECYYNLGDESTAREYLKQVRTRSIAEADDTLVTYKETGSALWTAIDNERRWEFMAEGIRGYDISRRAEDYKHPETSGGWTTVATPDNTTTYCWALPNYETTVNTAL